MRVRPILAIDARLVSRRAIRPGIARLALPA
jgi:hypothetical protein